MAAKLLKKFRSVFGLSVLSAAMRQRDEMPLAKSQLGLSQKLRQLCHIPRRMPRLIARE
jgi:hypothetical protein